MGTAPATAADHRGGLAVEDDWAEQAVWYDYDEHNNTPLAQSRPNTTVIQVQHSAWTFHTGMRTLAKALHVGTWSDPIFHHIFQLLLTPSPPVQQLVDDTMDRLGLIQHQYDAVHLRARYPGTSDIFRPKAGLFSRGIDADGIRWTKEARSEILRLVARAIDCVRRTNETQNNNSSPPLPIYFASDTNDAVRLVTNTATEQQQRVVGFVTPFEKLHLDRNDRIGLIRKTPPSAFYPAFVDLWILSQAQCLSIGAGGYGIVASILGKTDCVVFHQKNNFVAGASSGEADYLCLGEK